MQRVKYFSSIQKIQTRSVNVINTQVPESQQPKNVKASGLWPCFFVRLYAIAPISIGRISPSPSLSIYLSLLVSFSALYAISREIQNG